MSTKNEKKQMKIKPLTQPYLETLPSIISSSEDVAYLDRIQKKEDRLRSLTAPFENYITIIENILVWNFPFVSLLLVFFVNFLFWLYTLTPFYCLLSFLILIFLLFQFAANHIFNNLNDDSLDGSWTKLQEEKEGHFDLIKNLASLLVRVEWLFEHFDWLRRNNRERFSALGIVFSGLLLFISLFVNDFWFFYFIVMFSLFYPGMKHYKLLGKLNNFLKPKLERFEKKMCIRRTVNKKKLLRKIVSSKLKKEDKFSIKTNKIKELEQKIGEEEEEDDEDVYLKPFLPIITNNKSNKQHKTIKLSQRKKEDEEDDEEEDDSKEFYPDVNSFDFNDSSDEEFLPSQAISGDLSISLSLDENTKINKTYKNNKMKNKNNNIENSDVFEDNLVNGLKNNDSEEDDDELKLRSEKSRSFISKTIGGFGLVKSFMSSMIYSQKNNTTTFTNNNNNKRDSGLTEEEFDFVDEDEFINK